MFTLPFRGSVWIAIGVLLLVIMVMLFVTAKWEWKKTHGMQGSDDNETEPMVTDHLLLLLGVVAQQGKLIEIKMFS